MNAKQVLVTVVTSLIGVGAAACIVSKVYGNSFLPWKGFEKEARAAVVKANGEKKQQKADEKTKKEQKKEDKKIWKEIKPSVQKKFIEEHKAAKAKEVADAQAAADKAAADAALLQKAHDAMIQDYQKKVSNPAAPAAPVAPVAPVA